MFSELRVLEDVFIRLVSKLYIPYDLLFYS